MSLSRVKIWVAEVLTASDLNAEFNNILNYVNISPILAADALTKATGDTLQWTGSAWVNRAYTNNLSASTILATMETGVPLAGRAQKVTTIAASTTTDIFRFLDPTGTQTGTFFVSGLLFVNVIDEADGSNNSTYVLAITTSGDGSTDATLATVTSIVRGTALVTSFGVAADGLAGAAKLQLTTAGSGKAVTTRTAFIGLEK